VAGEYIFKEYVKISGIVPLWCSGFFGLGLSLEQHLQLCTIR